MVNISKLVVKELIEQSLRYGRMLDSDHMPLQHFFIVLEHVLRHGLRPKKVWYIKISDVQFVFNENFVGTFGSKERALGYIANGGKVRS